MTQKQIVEWIDRFVGYRVYSATSATNVGHGWLINDTSSAGTPTYTPVDGGAGVTLAFDSQAEAQNLCLSWGDVLGVDIDDIIQAAFRVKVSGTLDSATSLAFGLIGDRNDAIDSIAQNAIFRLIGNNNIVCETDDGTTDTDDKATGLTLSTTAKDFVISFAEGGKSDVRFFVDGAPVATATTFDVSAYSGALQPFMQLQKTSDANTDSATLELVKILYRR